MKFIYNSYKDMWTRALDFKGRSNNEEYWYPFFINLGICLIFHYLLHLSTVSLFYFIIFFVPFISLSIRRIHDTNKSGWNILWLYIPTILLIVYAGAILFFTQKPEIVDVFLKWFTAMVVGYVVVIVYSVYLLTSHSYPKKNHYGEVRNLHTKAILSSKDVDTDSITLEVSEGKNIEDTLTFKTKAFIEKARSRKKKEEQPVIQEEILADTVQLNNEEKLNTEDIQTEKKKKKVKEPVVKEMDEPIISVENPTSEIKEKTKEDIIVRAKLTPSKKPPIKKEKSLEAPIKQPNEIAKDIQKVEYSSSETKEEKEVVKTVAQKRAELQMTSVKSVDIKEAVKSPERSETKTVHRPVKRKVLQPIEIPDMNVESIRTHSLDSIAKLVEQNMTKDAKDTPTVVATIKRRPVKRKKKEEEN